MSTNEISVPRSGNVSSQSKGDSPLMGNVESALQTSRLKPDFASIQKRLGDSRTPSRLIAHYEIERRLGDRLRAASQSERSRVYPEIYSELFESLPDHPQKRAPDETCGVRVADRMRMLAPLLKPDAVYLEVGCGNAALPIAMARLASQVLGLDVTDALINFVAAPANFRFIKTDGVRIPLTDHAVDLAHSDQLMEHLHVEDAELQLAEIYRILKPGGRYICSTPNRVTGPHDISVFFDETATGLHMREYDYTSLRGLLLKAGFSSVSFLLVIRGFRFATPPYAVLRSIEKTLRRAPAAIRRGRIANLLMGITALATK